MARKLDMGKAWNDAVALISANRQVVLIVAGVFFLLPSLISALFVPPPEGLANMQPGAQPDPEVVIAMGLAWLEDSWWIILLASLVQTIGVLGLLALLTDRARPTVGEALRFGIFALPTYIGTQLITAAGFAAVFMVVAVIGALYVPLALVLGLALAVGTIYAGVKLMLVTPVIAIERIKSPLAVLARSWQLTKGNSLLLVSFVMLLLLAFLVISFVAELVLAIFAIMSQQAGVIANAIGGSLLSMALVVAMVAVLAAIHRQLAGDN